eukprot:1309593-Amphidinium_carterae.1
MANVLRLAHALRTHVCSILFVSAVFYKWTLVNMCSNPNDMFYLHLYAKGCHQSPHAIQEKHLDHCTRACQCAKPFTPLQRTGERGAKRRKRPGAVVQESPKARAQLQSLYRSSWRKETIGD